jgi:NADH-quinone oxidoreductase subunit L
MSLALVPLLPLLGVVVNTVLGRRASRVVAGSIASAVVGLAALVSFSILSTVLSSGPIDQVLWTWMHAGRFTADMALRADALSATMMCIVTGIGFLIHVYSVAYMDDPADRGSTWRFFVYLNLFIVAMLLLVMGSNFLVMFVGWEGVGLCSYLLIGFWFENSDYASAGKKAFVTNRVGDLSFVLGLFILFWSLGEHATLDFRQLEEVVAAHPHLVGGVGGGIVTLVCLLLFGGATGKSAQVPLYVWLPDAMAGPTPVSALIHAATMVTSGIYLLCRLNFLYVMAPAAMAVVATIGALTAFLAATIALTQNDIKKVLAYSTVSQLGFMFLGVGVGGFVAGFFHVLTHAFFKALMFLGAGSIIHALHHEQDMRHMGGLAKDMKLTFLVFACGYLAIIGFPGTSGFFSKDEILWLTFITPIFADLPLGTVMPKALWACATATAFLTAFYMSRLMFMTFAGKFRGHHHAHESGPVLVGPLVVLAILSLVGGVLNLPHWLPGAGMLHHALEPVFEHAQVAFPEHHPAEFPLMGFTLLGVAASVFLAHTMYVRWPELPALVAARIPRLYDGSLNKWFVDELYAAVLLNPIVLGSRHVLWSIVDVQVIDGAVNGAAAGAQALGRGHGLWANGRVQAYAVSIAIGTAVIVTAYALG